MFSTVIIASLIKSRLIQLHLKKKVSAVTCLCWLIAEDPAWQPKLYLSWNTVPSTYGGQGLWASRACPHKKLLPKPKSTHIYNWEVTELQNQGHTRIMESLTLVMTKDFTATSLNRKRGENGSQEHYVRWATSWTLPEWAREEFEEAGLLAGAGTAREMLFRYCYWDPSCLELEKF